MRRQKGVSKGRQTSLAELKVTHMKQASLAELKVTQNCTGTRAKNLRMRICNTGMLMRHCVDA